MTAVMMAAVLLAAVAGRSTAAELPVGVALRAIHGDTVEVRVENQTGERLDIAVASFFVLGSSERESYWAPFDPMTGKPYDMAVRVAPGKPIPPEPTPPRLRLRPKESWRVTIRLRDVKWARRISSVWPDQHLDEAVQPGSYPLVWELCTDDNSTGLRSQSITIDVPRR